MTPEEYKAKRDARIVRLRDRAREKAREGSAIVDSARRMADVIPLGQPILIGHHSEKRDRAYRGRIESGFRRGYETLDYAKSLEARAEAAESNTSIFSDDPEAGEKIQSKIERLEKRQEVMREANKAIRSGNDDRLRELGFSDDRVAALKQPDFAGRIGFPDYALTNNSANIRRLKQRLTSVSQAATREYVEQTIGEFRVVQDPDDNRVKLFFPKSLLPTVKEKLRSNGFRFSWENVCWQRHLTDSAVYIATEIAKSVPVQV